MQLFFDLVHGLLRQLDACLIGGSDQLDYRRHAFPSHGPSIGQHRFDRVEQGAIPVVFHNAPAAFDGVVLAVIGWVIG